MGEAAPPDVPDIEPSSFDLIVIGTGFQESLLAGAAAQAGKSVLHLDPASSYGAHWASHRLDTFLDWATAAQQRQQPSSRDGSGGSGSGGDQQRSGQRSGDEGSAAGAPPAAAADEIAVPAAGAGVYSHVSVWRDADADLGAARDYNIDLAAKAVLCAGPLVKALLASGAHNYVEFRALSSSWLWRGGRLTPVPATRADVFAAEGLTLPQRRALMRFLTAAQAAVQGGGPLQDAFDGRPFAQLLAEQGLQPGVRALLLYAVAMLEADQEPGPASPTPMPLAALPPAVRDSDAAAAAAAVAPASLRDAPAAASPPQSPDGAGAAPGGVSAPDAAAHAAAAAAAAAAANPAFGGGVATAAQGLEALRLYMQSAGKYGPGTGAFLLPCYGAGELPQAFCRVAAVAGAMYVLRRPVAAILLHPGTCAVRGVRLADGQQLSCQALAGDISAFAELQEAEEAEHLRGGGADGSAGAAAAQAAGASDGSGAAVARAVAITDAAPLQQGGGGGGSALVIFPPRSLPSGNAAAVRVLQVGFSTAAAPQGRFLLHAATAAGAPPAGRNAAGGAAAGCPPPPPALQDVQEALAALVSLPTAQQQQQQPQQQQSQQHEGLPPLPGPAVGNSAEADSRPRALLLASWVQSALAVSEGRLPPNAVCSAPPDGGLDFRAALAAATAAFAKLFPEAAAARGGQLFGTQASGGTGGGGGGSEDTDAAADFDDSGAADDDSDDDTLASLQAALAGIGGDTGTLVNGVPGTGHD